MAKEKVVEQRNKLEAGVAVVTTNPLEEKFKGLNFKKDTQEKIREVSHLSPLMKSLIVQGMTKFFNQHLNDSKKDITNINFTRFTKILDLMDVSEQKEMELIYEYREKDRLFQSQSDNLIAVFKFVLPEDPSEYDTMQRGIALIDSVNKAYLKQFGIRENLTVKTIKGGDLTMLCPIDAKALGCNPRESLEQLIKTNTNVIHYVFDFMLKQATHKKE
jgi:hypothetical protein